MASDSRELLEEAVSSSAVVAASQARVDRLVKLVRLRRLYAEYGIFSEEAYQAELAATRALVAAVHERQRRVVAWLALAKQGL